MLGCPIRKFADQFVCANPRNLSQLITSFIASESQGIRHTPLFTFLAITINFNYHLYFLIINMSKNSSAFAVVENIGVEPMTSCLQSRRSSQLS